MSDSPSNVIKLAFTTCPACRSGRHLRCRDWVGLAEGADANCPCGCWDDERRETKPWGHHGHAHVDPDSYARIMRTKLAIERSCSYDLHARTAKRSATS